MKKVSIVIAVALLFVIVISSCQGGKKCPAYSKVKTEKVKDIS